MHIRCLYLVTLLVVSWQDLTAEEARQLESGDYIRIRAPSIHATQIVGTVLALNADSLVLNQIKSPFHSVRLTIPVHDIKKLERKTASTGQWERLLALPTGESSIHLPEEFEDLARQVEQRWAWYNVGVGGSSIEDAFSFGLSFSVHRGGKHLISVRSIRSKQYLSRGRGDLPEQEAWEIGVLYGRTLQGVIGSASLSTGFGIVNWVRHGAFLRHAEYQYFVFWYASTRKYDIYEKRTFSTPGIPIDVQLLAVPHPFFGIGFHGFANLNPEQSYWGALLCLSLGIAR